MFEDYAERVDPRVFSRRLSKWLYVPVPLRRASRLRHATDRHRRLVQVLKDMTHDGEGEHWLGQSTGTELAEQGDLDLMAAQRRQQRDQRDKDDGDSSSDDDNENDEEGGAKDRPEYHRRILYDAVSVDGQVYRVGDGVLLKNVADADSPFLSRIVKLWEDRPTGQKLVLVNWLYRPADTRKRRVEHGKHECFLSSATDVNVLSAIEGRLVVLSYDDFTEQYDDEDESITDVFFCRASYNPRSSSYREIQYTSDKKTLKKFANKAKKRAATVSGAAPADADADGAAGSPASTAGAGNDDEDELLTTPTKPAKGKAVRKGAAKLTPIPRTKKPRMFGRLLPPRVLPLAEVEDTDMFEQAKLRLHISAVPPGLPGRDAEFAEVLRYVEGAVEEGTGACVFISGVPGTGKTATVLQVIRHLQAKADDGQLPPFDFVELNGMRLTDPNNAYPTLWESLTGKRATVAQAADLLDKHFSTPNPRRHSCVVLMDEMDLLVTRKQNVIYNLFDWPSRKHARLLVIAVANTMDLPERQLASRVSSRLGLSRITFEPYTFQQLRQILTNRLEGVQALDGDAIEFCARKVASVSGDARRALDVCRRAVEFVHDDNAAADPDAPKKLGTIQHIDRALKEMHATSTSQTIRTASKQEKIFLCSVLTLLRTTGATETCFIDAARRHQAMCRMHHVTVPNISNIALICSRLGASRVLLTDASSEDFSQRIRFNVTESDVRETLKDDNGVKDMVPT